MAMQLIAAPRLKVSIYLQRHPLNINDEQRGECILNLPADVASKFAKEGFSVYGIEYEGHGRSSGLSVYIDNFDLLIDDVSSHFSNISGKSPFLTSGLHFDTVENANIR